MADLTPERLAEIRERVKAAPIGPWGVERGYPQVLHNGGEDILAEFHQDVDKEPTAAAFAAAAREDVPDLLDEVERLRKALHNGRAERDTLRSDLAEYRTANNRMQQLITRRAADAERATIRQGSAEAERDDARAALAQITAAAQRAARSDDPAPILYAALQAVERDDAQRRLEDDLRELAVLRRDVGAIQVERDRALDGPEAPDSAPRGDDPW